MWSTQQNFVDERVSIARAVIGTAQWNVFEAQATSDAIHSDLKDKSFSKVGKSTSKNSHVQLVIVIKKKSWFPALVVSALTFLSSIVYNRCN